MRVEDSHREADPQFIWPNRLTKWVGAELINTNYHRCRTINKIRMYEAVTDEERAAKKRAARALRAMVAA